MRWSNLKARVERFFAGSIKGRVELRSASYRKAADGEGRGFITIDGAEVWNMDTWRFFCAEHEKMTAIRKRADLSPADAQPIAHAELSTEGVLSQHAYYRALERSCNSSLDESLTSEDVLIRSLAMLDSRLGKRRLLTLDTSREHPMVAYFYDLRAKAEGVVVQAISPAAPDQPTAH